MSLGVDRYYEALQARHERKYDEYWPTCDECGDKLGEYHYDTPEGRLCQMCAFDLARKNVEADYPDSEDAYAEHEDAVDEYLDEWVKETDYEY